VWQSPDPILGDYLSGKINRGVFNSLNLDLYIYGFNNPVGYRDYDGKNPWQVANIMYKNYKNMKSEKIVGADKFFHANANFESGRLIRENFKKINWINPYDIKSEVKKYEVGADITTTLLGDIGREVVFMPKEIIENYHENHTETKRTPIEEMKVIAKSITKAVRDSAEDMGANLYGLYHGLAGSSNDVLGNTMNNFKKSKSLLQQKGYLPSEEK
jgi:hypothetical protein